MDLDTFGEFASALRDGGVAVDKVVGTIDKVKGLLGSSQPASQTEMKTLVAELTLEIADAKLANAALKEILARMREETIKGNESRAKLERYELWETPVGEFVYRLKEEAKGTQPMHHICPACYENSEISILQGNQYAKNCHGCSTTISFSEWSQPDFPDNLC